MAIYRCEIKTVSRSHGRSAVACAAYRAGVRLTDHCDYVTKSRKAHDYQRKGGVVVSGVIVPEDTPLALADRQALWNAQERAETRKNSRVAREAVIALPHELNDQQRHEVVRQYAKTIMQRYGVACDYAIHRPAKGGDERNHHAHILFTTRRITAEGFGEKTRELDDKQQGAEEVTYLRQTWEQHCNAALATAQKVIRVDCRSLHAQGIQRLPEPKQGAIATRRERQGKSSHAGQERRAVKAYNGSLKGKAAQQHIRQARIALWRRRRRHKPVIPWLVRRIIALRSYRTIAPLCRQFMQHASPTIPKGNKPNYATPQIE